MSIVASNAVYYITHIDVYCSW